MSAEYEPFEAQTNTYDLWAEFDNAERKLKPRFAELKRLLESRHMEDMTPKSVEQSYDVDEGTTQIVGFKMPDTKHATLQRLIINQPLHDTSDYTKRYLEVRDYMIDFEQSSLLSRVTRVPMFRDENGELAAFLRADSGPVIEYRALDCELRTGTSYAEQAVPNEFGSSSLYELNELIGLISRTTPEPIVGFSTSITKGD